MTPNPAVTDQIGVIADMYAQAVTDMLEARALADQLAAALRVEERKRPIARPITDKALAAYEARSWKNT